MRNISLTTSGKDGVYFKEIWVQHKEALRPTAAAPALATAAAEIVSGSQVQVLSGKYSGCAGRVDKFSSSTGKPRVCRSVLGY